QQTGKTGRIHLAAQATQSEKRPGSLENGHNSDARIKVLCFVIVVIVDAEKAMPHRHELLHPPIQHVDVLRPIVSRTRVDPTRQCELVTSTTTHAILRERSAPDRSQARSVTPLLASGRRSSRSVLRALDELHHARTAQRPVHRTNRTNANQ